MNTPFLSMFQKMSTTPQFIAHGRPRHTHAERLCTASASSRPSAHRYPPGLRRPHAWYRQRPHCFDQSKRTTCMATMATLPVKPDMHIHAAHIADAGDSFGQPVPGAGRGPRHVWQPSSTERVRPIPDPPLAPPRLMITTTPSSLRPHYACPASPLAFPLALRRVRLARTPPRRAVRPHSRRRLRKPFTCASVLTLAG